MFHAGREFYIAGMSHDAMAILLDDFEKKQGFRFFMFVLLVVVSVICLLLFEETSCAATTL
jgi:Na+/melibiose symporter-like transporter